MGFNVADTVTGRVIGYGQPVVGFLLQHRQNDYPLKDNPVASANSPTHYFALESLPLFGTCGDCGLMDIEDEQQLGVQLVLRMTGYPDWESFSEAAFNSRGGVNIPARDGKSTTVVRHYGLALMHLSTYQYLLQGRSPGAHAESSSGYPGLYRQAEDKLSDLAKTVAMFEEALAFPCRPCYVKPQPDVIPDGFLELGTWAHLCNLTDKRRDAHRDNLGIDDLPELCSALGRTNAEFGPDFKRTLQGAHWLGWELLAGPVKSLEEIPELPALLGFLWDCMQIGNRMYDLHAIFRPSDYASDDINNISIIETARMNIETAWADHLERETGWVRDDFKNLDEEMQKMQALMDRMTAMRDDAILRYHEM